MIKHFEKVLKLLDDYSTTPFGAKYKTDYEKEMEILTPKQMIQRLPIALT